MYPTNLSTWSCNSKLIESDDQYYKIETIIEPNSNMKDEIKYINNLSHNVDNDYKKTKILGSNLDGYKYMGNRNDSSSKSIYSLYDTVYLDKKPNKGIINIDNIYNIDNSNYGGIYKDYSDINSGNVKYYVRPSLTQIRNNNVYSKSGIISKMLYKNPQMTIKPDYLYKPLFNDNNSEPMNPFLIKDVQHTLNNREELISLQTRNMDNNSYSKRFF